MGAQKKKEKLMTMQQKLTDLLPQTSEATDTDPEPAATTSRSSRSSKAAGGKK